MSIYDDLLAYAGEGLYESDEGDPLFNQFVAGDVPRPIEWYFKDVGEQPTQRPRRPVLDPLKILTTGESWTMDHTARLGEILGAHTQKVGRDVALSLLSTSQFLNSMKQKFIPYYNENTAVKAVADTLSKFGAGVMAMDREQELALAMLAESEYLKADPRALETHNWFEDLVSVGPQIGSMILANIAGGPWAGFGMIGMQILGGTYDSLVQQGTPPEEAYLWSVANAAGQGYLEMVPFLKVMNKFKLRMPMLERLKVLGAAAGTEFLTEWAQSYPDSFTNIFATNPDKTLWERAEMFVDRLWDTTKEGMYEGTLTAPWTLLMTPFGAVAHKVHQRRKLEDESNYFWRRIEEVQRAKRDAADEGDFIPFDEQTIMGRRAPSRRASSVTQAHLDMMTPEQREQYREMPYGRQWQETLDRLNRINPAERAAREARAFDFADRYAEVIGQIGKDAFSQQPELEAVEREMILQDLGLVQTQDVYDGARDAIGIIRGDGIPDRTVFDESNRLELTEEEYKRRQQLLGNLSDYYTVDKSQIPADLRGAFGMMAEQIGGAEPKGATFIGATGEVNLQEGLAQGYGSSYPTWFKAPFRIGYYDMRIKYDKDGKKVMEPMTDKEGKPVLFKKGKKKGQQKMVPVRELRELSEEFKFGLNRKDFFDTIDRLENGKTMTGRQRAIADHIMGIAQALKYSDPELFMQGDIDQLEADGYTIHGNELAIGDLDLGDQVVVEGQGGKWDTYTVVSEDDGAGNMVMDSLSDRIQGPPTDEVKAVAFKKNGYWQSMYDIGGPQAMAEAPKTLPGINDIEPLHVLEDVYSTAQMEEDFAENLPDLAEFFENPDGVRVRGRPDRRQADVPVEVDRRSGVERRTNWQHTASLDEMSYKDLVDALQLTRKDAITDILTGLLNQNALEMHKQEFGEDVPFVMIDLDGLKYFNDMTKAGLLPTGEWVEGGHELGNQVLALMGRAMQQAADITGATDRVKLYRHGGDEYGVTGIDRDSITEEELEILRNAIRDTASQIMLDFLGYNDKHYNLNGLAFQSSTRSTIKDATAATEDIKKALKSEYETLIKEGEEEPTRARIPGTRVEVNYLPVGWRQKGTGVLASEARAAEEVGRRLSQAEPAAIEERIVDVNLVGRNFQWGPDDTIEDAIAWTMANTRRLVQSAYLPDTNAWDWILSELTYEAEDIGMPPNMLAHGLNAGAMDLARQYLSDEQLGIPLEAPPAVRPEEAPTPEIVAPPEALPPPTDERKAEILATKTPEVREALAALPPGRPFEQVMYRGEGPVPERGFRSDAGDLGRGEYWTSEEAQASVYAMGMEDRVVTKTLRLRNALQLPGRDAYDLADDVYGTIRGQRPPNEGVGTEQARLAAANRLTNDLMELGYDGMVVTHRLGNLEAVVFKRALPLPAEVAPLRARIAPAKPAPPPVIKPTVKPPAIAKKKVPPVKKPARPKLPAPPPKLAPPEVVTAEILPTPEQAPTEKSRKAKFVRENIEFMPLAEMVTVKYVDPKTGDIFEIEETAREAFQDLEDNVNEFYQLMECMKT